MNEVEFILFDPQDITRLGLKTLLLHQFPEAAVYEIHSKNQLRSALHQHQEALVMLDYTLADMSDAEELLHLAQRYLLVRWIIFSNELSWSFLRRIQTGSDTISVLFKDAPLNECNTVIRLTAEGKQSFDDKTWQMLTATPPSQQEKPVLTETEQSILRFMSLGKTTKEIAAEKHLSFHTVNTHRKNIFHKLEVNNIHEATKYALRAGILSIAEYMI
ncbi:MAG: response regulator transcription factor [Microbacter sp.]